MGDSQSQKAGERSTLIQAGGNVTIGLSYADVKLMILEEREQIVQHVWERAQEMLREAGIQPGPVPMNTFIPLLQNASLEEDPFLQERWSALLANTSQGRVLPAFPDILRQLTRTEAIFLDRIYQIVAKRMPRESPFSAPSARWALTVNLGSWHELMIIFADAGLTKHKGHELICIDEPPDSSPDHIAFMIATDNLLRANLLLRSAVTKLRKQDVGKSNDSGLPLESEDRYAMTALGFEFVSACQPPNDGPVR
jgi:hypothetical protein